MLNLQGAKDSFFIQIYRSDFTHLSYFDGSSSLKNGIDDFMNWPFQFLELAKLATFLQFWLRGHLVKYFELSTEHPVYCAI